MAERMDWFQRNNIIDSFNTSIVELHDWLRVVADSGNRNKARAVRSVMVRFIRRRDNIIQNVKPVFDEPDNNFD